MYKRVFLIINPASGADFPILSVANDFFKKHKIEWEVFVTKKKNDAQKFAERVNPKKFDLIAVYGGDGTVMEVARGASKTGLPLLIIPGGTANVVAREFKIPLKAELAIELINKDKSFIKRIDTFSCNNRICVIRLNIGVFGDIVRKTRRKTKNTFGSLSYALTTFTKIVPRTFRYKVKVDKKSYRLKGVGMLLANIGTIGLSDMAVLPKILADDSWLDVVLLKSIDFKSIISVATGVLLRRKTTLKHIQGKKVEITFEKTLPVVFDDEVIKTEKVVALIRPKSLSLVIPKVDG